MSIVTGEFRRLNIYHVLSSMRCFCRDTTRMSKNTRKSRSSSQTSHYPTITAVYTTNLISILPTPVIGSTNRNRPHLSFHLLFPSLGGIVHVALAYRDGFGFCPTRVQERLWSILWRSGLPEKADCVARWGRGESR